MLDEQTRQDAKAGPQTAAGCLHELFDVQADAAPHATAIIRDDKSWTYGKLEKQANRLAQHLKARGIGPGKLVGLAFERSEFPIVAILACLKAGAAYVPIDPGHPDERIRYIVEEADLEHVLSERSLIDRVRRAFAGTIISADEHAAAIGSEHATRL